MLQVLATLLAYAYLGFLVVGCFVYTAVCLVLELAGFRTENPRFEGDKLIYRS